MKIVVEAVQDSSYVTGTDRIAYNILRELQAMDKQNNYIVICAREYPFIAESITASNFRVVRRRAFRKRYLKIVGIPLEVMQLLYFKWVIRPDVHYMVRNLSVPRIKFAPLVIDVLDLIPLIYSERYFAAPRDYQRYLASVRRAAGLADRLIAISRHTQADVTQRLDVSANRVEVVYLATESKFRVISDADERARVSAKYHLPENFVLTIGSNEPRKNVKTVLAAYQLLPEAMRTSCLLVVAGGRWRGGGAGDELKAPDDTVFTGFVDDADLPVLYGMAKVFVFLSTYEGFGLPPLEAMACGTPVVCSNSTSMPEAGGDAALMVDPDDAQAAARAMAQILGDAGQAEKMSLAGRARAATFSWHKTAQQVLAILEAAARG